MFAVFDFEFATSTAPTMWSIRLEVGGGGEAGGLSHLADSWTLPQFFDYMAAAGR